VGVGTTDLKAKMAIGLTGVAITGDTDGATMGENAIAHLLDSNAGATNSTVMLLGGGGGVTGQIKSGIGFSRENASNWGTQLRFYTHSTATSDLDELNEAMRIDSSGNLGIGTDAPGRQLHVKSTAANNTIIKVEGTYADGYRHGFEASNTHTGGAVWSMVSTNNSDGVFGGGKLVIANEASQLIDASTPAKLVINSIGHVGIGGQINPSYPLDVTGDTIQNGVRTFTARFNVANNVAIGFDVVVPNEGGGGNSFMIHCGHNHYYITSYGTHRIAMVSARGTNLSDVINVGHQTSGNGGSWNFSKPSATLLRITKNAGSYGGGGAGFIHVTFSSFM
jgi:hypothetical protein